MARLVKETVPSLYQHGGEREYVVRPQGRFEHLFFTDVGKNGKKEKRFSPHEEAAAQKFQSDVERQAKLREANTPKVRLAEKENIDTFSWVQKTERGDSAVIVAHHWAAYCALQQIVQTLSPRYTYPMQLLHINSEEAKAYAEQINNLAKTLVLKRKNDLKPIKYVPY